MIRWGQIQNIDTTEQEINLLAGLTANSSQINVLDGYTGTTADLNNAIGVGTTLTGHIADDAATAHTFLAGTINGSALIDGTISEAKLAFDTATQADLASLQALHNNLQTDHDTLQSQVDTLAAVVIPGQGQDIAEAVDQAVQHISNPENAHDASAISYGENQSGYYFPLSDLGAGNNVVEVGLANVRYFRVNDSVDYESNTAPLVSTTISAVNYDTGFITLAAAPPVAYTTAADFKIWNNDEKNVQEGIDRSLKNNTDDFTGRLKINQDNGENQVLVLSQDGTGTFTRTPTLGSVPDDAIFDGANKWEYNTTFDHTTITWGGSVILSQEPGELTQYTVGNITYYRGVFWSSPFPSLEQYKIYIEETVPAEEELAFNQGTISTQNGLTLQNSTDLVIYTIDDAGNSMSNTHTLRDFSNSYDGLITKEPLTEDRTWTFPDRDGFVAIGDMTFWDLLRVTADTTLGQLTVAPGYMTDLYGQKVSAWINMASSSQYTGEVVDVVTQFGLDSQIAGLGSDYLAFIIYLTYNDDLFFWYSSVEATEQDAILNIPPYLPTAFMKLALVTVQGDGAGGIDASTLTIHEDMRPILSQGMSNAHYDESIYYAAGLSGGTAVAIPENSRAGNKPQGYIIGSAELQVYVNDTFREPGRDYIELTGSAPGQIVFNYDLPTDSVVRFRIDWGAATNISGAGGGGGGNLQDAYLGGPNIFTSPGIPVLISAGTDTALELNGHLDVNGTISSLQGTEFVNQSSEPGSPTSVNNKLYSNLSGDLLYKNFSNSTTYNITEQLENSSQQQGRVYLNDTGATIPAFKTVALHPTISGQIVLADVSSNTPAARVIGITTAAIADGDSGLIVWQGYVANAGTGFTHNSVVVAEPAAAGSIAEETFAGLTTGNMVVEIGIVDGSGMLVNINRKGQY